jgi:hypothetical protein
MRLHNPATDHPTDDAQHRHAVMTNNAPCGFSIAKSFDVTAERHVAAIVAQAQLGFPTM